MSRAEIKRVLAAPHAYAVLGLTRGCTELEAQLARRELARALHPDRCRLPEAERAMAAVNVATDALSAEVKYGAGLRARKGAEPCPACAGRGAVRTGRGFKAVRLTPCLGCAGAGTIFNIKE